jgi:myo-inositol-1(or 4)-monophosphatase
MSEIISFAKAVAKEAGAMIVRERLDFDLALWIVDPIDGTVNYAHGHAQSAVSIAHVEAGKIVAAAVYNPFTDELFSAESGRGAFLNDVRIHVAGETELKRAIIATGFPPDKTNLQPIIDRVGKVLAECADIRRLGAAALDICWVAVGRLDGFYESLCLWDFAAAQLIAREAGAQYGHFKEVPDGISPEFHCDNILVANPVLFSKMQAILKNT